jgi:CubicO group peptidase (beta-lactamase class C family)
MAHFSRFGKRRLLVGCCLALLIAAVVWFSWKPYSSDLYPDRQIARYILPSLPGLKPEIQQPLELGCGSWFRHFLMNQGFSGGILVAHHGHVVYERYQGMEKLHGAVAVTSNSPFHIASVSKTFTAMAVLRLCQEKRIDLDQSFQHYFPGFNYPGVTIRSLLNHRSGLPNYVYFMEEIGWDIRRFVRNEDVLQWMIDKRHIIRNIEKPNRRFQYCNTNYVLLALLIEKVTGQSFPAYLKQSIFDPLDMNHSFVYTDADSLRATPSYNWKGQEEAFTYLDKTYGDKNIFSTPGDLLKWDRLLRTDAYLNAAMLQQAYLPYSNEHRGTRNYGLGWRMIAMDEDNPIIYHNGWWHGSNAVFIRLLKEDATIIVLGNRYNRNIYKARELIGLFKQRFESDLGD